MFAIGIELLSGRYVATAYNDRERAEWPPHPARLFSALIATWAEGDPSSDHGEAELAALRWFEQQSAPDILASAPKFAGIRDVVPVFVPVNDVSLVSPPSRDKLDEAQTALELAAEPKARARAEKAIKKLEQKLAADTAKAIGVPTKVGKTDAVHAEQLVSDRRNRQPRTFPSVGPACGRIGFVWPDADPPADVQSSMMSLLSRLVRLGHSSSLVRAWPLSADEIVELDGHTVRYQPDEDEGELSIRWVGAGQVDRLVEAYDRHHETEPRVLPARFVRYRLGQRLLPRPMRQSLFTDEFIVLARVGGPRLPITSVAGLARQLRRALMSYAEQPIHEVLSGHQPTGDASEAPHVAVVPLPLVSGQQADGAILGIGIVMPRRLDETGRRAVMRAIGTFEQQGAQHNEAEAPVISLLLGDAGVLQLQRVAWGEDRRATLRPTTWCRGSRRWASATPIALDRNPGDLHDVDPAKRRDAFREATASVIESVERIGLPAPVEVDVVRSCVLPGSAKPRAYPRFPSDPRRSQRVLVHARLVFAEPVRGPVLVGAGRYHGLGLCLPVDDSRDEVR